MDNKGSVTIFCSLMIIAMVILGISSIKVVEHHLAKSKGAMVVKSAMSGVDAGYNSYIFENYHILLFDKNCDGRGEAFLEERLSEDIQLNLGEEFVVENVGVTDYKFLLENNCSAFKEQMEDYCGYALVEYGADSILTSTGGKDGTVADYIYEDMEAAKEGANEENNINDSQEASENVDLGQIAEEVEEKDDPREYTENLSTDGILALVVPENMEVSNQSVDLSQVPSMEGSRWEGASYNIDRSFEDMDILKMDVGRYESWKDALVNGSVGIAYAASVFNCATESIQENTVFELELEYIICGKASDRANLQGVVNRIIGIRFPVNYGYLVTDSQKMAEIARISGPIALSSLAPEPVVRYLIAGCWAYVESMFDARCLLKGQRIDFVKNRTTWKTDLRNLENMVNLEGEESNTGMCYKDYLLILLALDMEDSYYRMSDIIELNTKQYYEYFDMNNAAVGFQLDTQISYQGRNYYFSETMGY